MEISALDRQLLENSLRQKINKYNNSGVTFKDFDFNAILNEIINNEIPKGDLSQVQKLGDDWCIADGYIDDLMFRHQ